MRWILVCGGLLVATVGCSRHEKKPTAKSDAPAHKSSPSVLASGALDSGSSGTFEPSAANVDAAVSPPRSAAEIARNERPPLEASLEQPVIRANTSKGKLVVWSIEDGKGSAILAGYEPKAGELDGEAKVLRRTSGHVAALDVVNLGVDAGADAGLAVPEDLVVGWTSNLPDGKGQVAAVVFANVDLSRVTMPRTLGIVNASVSQEGHIAMRKNPRGGVVVAHEGSTGRCSLSDMPVECVTYEVKAVAFDGKVTKLGGGKLHGGPSPEYTLVDLDGHGLAVYASSMRGGRTLDAIVVPYVAGEPAPPFDVPTCGGDAGYAPEVLRGARGELVAICLESLDEACAKSVRDKQKRCARVAVTGADGRTVTPKGHDAHATRVDCAGGKTKVAFAGGDVTLATPSEHLADFPHCASPAPR